MARNSFFDNVLKDYNSKVGIYANIQENVTTKNITIDLSKKFNSVQACFISDTHIGSSDFNMKELILALKYADSQPNAIIFFLGDGMNNAISGSKSDQYEDVLNPQTELDTYSQILKLAKGNDNIINTLKNLHDTGKIVVVHDGNHEVRTQKAVGISPTKVATSYAGVEDAYVPFYANIDLILRQPLEEDGQHHINIITHHGTGIHNVDGVFRLLKNINNADMCVTGHIHQHNVKTERVIYANEDGNRYYRDVMEMVLPASGGGTYGAGMCLPDIHKQSAVWLEICSRENPFKDVISPTGIKQQEFIPTFAFFNPTLNSNTIIKAKRINQAENIIDEVTSKYQPQIADAQDVLLGVLEDYEEEMRGKITGKIAEKPRKTPKGFDENIINEKNEVSTPIDDNSKIVGEQNINVLDDGEMVNILDVDTEDDLTMGGK